MVKLISIFLQLSTVNKPRKILGHSLVEQNNESGEEDIQKINKKIKQFSYFHIPFAKFQKNEQVREFILLLISRLHTRLHNTITQKTAIDVINVCTVNLFTSLHVYLIMQHVSDLYGLSSGCCLCNYSANQELYYV